MLSFWLCYWWKKTHFNNSRKWKYSNRRKETDAASCKWSNDNGKSNSIFIKKWEWMHMCQMLSALVHFSVGSVRTEVRIHRSYIEKPGRMGVWHIMYAKKWNGLTWSEEKWTSHSTFALMIVVIFHVKDNRNHPDIWGQRSIDAGNFRIRRASGPVSIHWLNLRLIYNKTRSVSR